MAEINKRNITVLFPGGFKPLTGAHLALAERYAQHPDTDKVILLIGPKDRDGITREKTIHNSDIEGLKQDFTTFMESLLTESNQRFVTDLPNINGKEFGLTFGETQVLRSSRQSVETIGVEAQSFYDVMAHFASLR